MRASEYDDAPQFQSHSLPERGGLCVWLTSKLQTARAGEEKHTARIGCLLGGERRDDRRGGMITRRGGGEAWI